MDISFQLAPMAELSHRAFRELIEDFGGCDEYFSEMISASALLANGPLEKWYIDPAPVPQKTIFQLIGADSGQICRAAAVLDRLDCAGIDINMGCSAPFIRKTGAGAGWMASIDKAGSLISEVRPAVKHRLSVKLRIGFKDDFEYLVNFCRRLEEEGVDLIILHPRTVMQKFTRLAKWEYVGRLKQELKIPVAGNGDIATAEGLIRRANDPSCPCDALMVGRAAVRYPWIFAQAKSLSACQSLPSQNQEILPNIEEVGLRFLELLARYQPPEFHRSRALRFFSYFADNLKWGNHLKNMLNREATLAGIEKVWKGYFYQAAF